MDEPDVGEPPTVAPVATANFETVVKYLKNVSLVVFEEDEPCAALDRVSYYRVEKCVLGWF